MRQSPPWADATPRQAVAEGGTALRELLALLDDFEWQERDTRGGLGMSSVRY